MPIDAFLASVKYEDGSPKLVYLGSCVQLYLLAETPQLSPSPAFELMLRGRYWSAKIDDISL
jgi:hypothetical protein